MNNVMLPEQDFFLYVPASRDAEETHLLPGILEAGGQGSSHVSTTLENWQKIPLEGKFTVYARIWETEE